jgi:hypothetical protein
VKKDNGTAVPRAALMAAMLEREKVVSMDVLWDGKKAALRMG